MLQVSLDFELVDSSKLITLNKEKALYTWRTIVSKIFILNAYFKSTHMHTCDLIRKFCCRFENMCVLKGPSLWLQLWCSKEMIH